jgi:hypothetical protein
MWKPEKTVTLVIETRGGVDLDPKVVEEKLGGGEFTYNEVRVTDTASGKVSEVSVIAHTKCIDCGSLDGKLYGSSRSGCHENVGPYCEKCKKKVERYYWPLDGSCWRPRIPVEMSGYAEPCEAFRTITGSQPTGRCEICRWWRNECTEHKN